MPQWNISYLTSYDGFHSKHCSMKIVCKIRFGPCVKEYVKQKWILSLDVYFIPKITHVYVNIPKSKTLVASSILDRVHSTYIMSMKRQLQNGRKNCLSYVWWAPCVYNIQKTLCINTETPITKTTIKKWAKNLNIVLSSLEKVCWWPVSSWKDAWAWLRHWISWLISWLKSCTSWLEKHVRSLCECPKPQKEGETEEMG